MFWNIFKNFVYGFSLEKQTIPFIKTVSFLPYSEKSVEYRVLGWMSEIKGSFGAKISITKC